MINSLSRATDWPRLKSFSPINGRTSIFDPFSRKPKVCNWLKLLFLNRWPRQIPALVKRQIGFLGLTGNGLPSRSMRRRQKFSVFRHFETLSRKWENSRGLYLAEIYSTSSASERYIVTYYWQYLKLGIKQLGPILSLEIIQIRFAIYFLKYFLT